MVQIGQKYRVLPAFVGSEKNHYNARMQVGTVFWIHPKLQHIVLEFEGVSAKPREGFHLDELTEKNLVIEKKGKRK